MVKAVPSLCLICSLCIALLCSIGFAGWGGAALLSVSLRDTKSAKQTIKTSNNINSTSTISTTTDNSSSSITVSPFANPPKIVILPGPHKTGTTSVQDCMVRWTVHVENENNNNNPNKKEYALANWSWAIPSAESLEQVHLKYLGAHKSFAQLVGVLRHHKLYNLPVDKEGGRGGKVEKMATDKEQVLQVYREAISSAWQVGKNIVFGSEEMDGIVSDRGRASRNNGTEILEGILDVLPWDDENRVLSMTDVEVVVTFRAPRIDHLISLWHQTGEPDQSLSSYLSTERAAIFVTNSLGLVLRFLERGVPTTLIDMSGVYDRSHHEPFGMCQVIACDIFRVECDRHHQITNLQEGQSDARLNAREGRGKMDLSDEQLESIDAIMNRYDCSLRSRLLEYLVVEDGGSNNKSKQLLRVLYSNELFRHCYPELDDYDGVDFSWMVQEIRKIVSRRRPLRR